MKSRSNIIKVFLVVIICFVSLMMVADFANAVREYKYYRGNNSNGERDCLAASGGRSNFNSVKYACNKAYVGDNGPQNACATWIGPTDNSAAISITKYINKNTTSVPISIYGMCTDDYNTTSTLIIGKVGSTSPIDYINGYNKHFRRGWPWGSGVTSEPANIDVAGFKRAATKTVSGKTTIYKMQVWIVRGHDDGHSYDYDRTWIYLIEGEGEEDLELCKSWGPSTSSSSTNGTSEVIIKIKNMEGRLSGTRNGSWQDDHVYAMPTDTVNWHTCYYPGVQATAFTSVSDINGTRVDGNGNGYPELPTNSCLSSQPVIGFKQIAVATRNPIGQKWENHFRVTGAGGSWASINQYGDFGDGVWQWDKRMQKRNAYQTRLLDVDPPHEKQEDAYTSIPQTSVVSDLESSRDVYISPCPLEIDYYNYLTTPPTPVYKPQRFDCYTCTNRYVDSGGNSVTAKRANVNYSEDNENAKVIIPYNYVLKPTVKLSGTVYSGETVTVSEALVAVGQRNNGETLATYATKVPTAKAKLFAYVSSSNDGGEMDSSSSDGCDVLKDRTKQCLEIKDYGNIGALNEGGDLDGGSPRYLDENKLYNAFDATAGDYVCYSLAVWPAESNGDTDTGSNGNGRWRYSTPACKIIAKKPTFQVWGGSMYSTGPIASSMPNKNNLYGIKYVATGGSKTVSGFNKTAGGNYRYAPWVEESLILGNGTTNTVYSGAGASKLEGGGVFCNTTSSNGIWLTFSNDCINSTASKSGISSGISSSNRDVLFDYWIGGSAGSVNIAGGYTIDLANKRATKSSNPNVDLEQDKFKKETAVKDVNLRYIYASGNLALKGGVKGGVQGPNVGYTYLIRASGTVTITGDVRYSASYSNAAQIPKVIIYAKNVNIRCGVKEVDAIIITQSGGTVNTCSDGTSDLNEEKRSNQLKIVGIVITDKVELGRTYGAAASNSGAKAGNDATIPASKNSGASAPSSNNVAAEIFDYDSTMPIWEESMAGSAETDTYTTVYQRELAPRY